MKMVLCHLHIINTLVLILLVVVLVVSGCYNYKILNPKLSEQGIQDFNQYMMDIVLPGVVMAQDIIDGEEG